MHLNNTSGALKPRVPARFAFKAGLERNLGIERLQNNVMAHLASSVGQPIVSGRNSDFSREILIDLRFALFHFGTSFKSPCIALRIGAVCRHPVSFSSLKGNSFRSCIRDSVEQWQSTDLCEAKVHHRPCILDGIEQKVGRLKIPVYNSTGMNIP
jgi:hypothetical protein